MIDQDELLLLFEPITEADIPELTDVMTRAFDDDTQRHLGQARGGPDGYDTGEFFRKWLFGYEESVGYKVVAGGAIVGALIVWILPGGHNVLGTIFVDPAYQDHGLGTRMWKFVEQQYPEAQSWRLETPAWATKNHAFYERKCGFQRVKSDPVLGMSDDMYMYRKEMKPRPTS